MWCCLCNCQTPVPAWACMHAPLNEVGTLVLCAEVSCQVVLLSSIMIVVFNKTRMQAHAQAGTMGLCWQ